MEKQKKSKALPKWERDALQALQDLTHLWAYPPHARRAAVEAAKTHLRLLRQRARRAENARNRLHQKLYGVPYGDKS